MFAPYTKAVRSEFIRQTLDSVDKVYGVAIVTFFIVAVILLPAFFIGLSL